LKLGCKNLKKKAEYWMERNLLSSNRLEKDKLLSKVE